VFVGPNGVGKSMFAQNIADQAVIDGHTVLFTSAGQLLGDLCALDSDSALQRRLRHYARPQLLIIDEVGSAIYPIPTVTPTCCSNWSRGAIRTKAR
jgi:DNA replication protein DnaC